MASGQHAAGHTRKLKRLMRANIPEGSVDAVIIDTTIVKVCDHRGRGAVGVLLNTLHCYGHKTASKAVSEEVTCENSALLMGYCTLVGAVARGYRAFAGEIDDCIKPKPMRYELSGMRLIHYQRRGEGLCALQGLRMKQGLNFHWYGCRKYQCRRSVYIIAMLPEFRTRHSGIWVIRSARWR